MGQYEQQTTSLPNDFEYFMEKIKNLDPLESKEWSDMAHGLIYAPTRAKPVLAARHKCQKPLKLAALGGRFKDGRFSFIVKNFLLF